MPPILQQTAAEVCGFALATTKRRSQPSPELMIECFIKERRGKATTARTERTVPKLSLASDWALAHGSTELRRPAKSPHASAQHHCAPAGAERQEHHSGEARIGIRMLEPGDEQAQLHR